MAGDLTDAIICSSVCGESTFVDGYIVQIYIATAGYSRTCSYLHHFYYYAYEYATKLVITEPWPIPPN